MFILIENATVSICAFVWLQFGTSW